MKIKSLLFTAVLSLLCHVMAYAQADTKGTDFWLAFGRNGTDLQIRIVGSDQPASGTIYFTASNTSIPFTVSAGGVFTYSLSTTEKANVSNTTTGSSNKSIHITSSAPVTAYALNQQSASTDATNVLPVTALGTDYYDVSYRPASSSDIYFVVATENVTHVYHNNTLVATLDAGDVYTRTSGSDMTGAHITSDKPVAFFAASAGVQIPNGYTYIDILFQQLAPVNTWGKNFFVPASYCGKDIVRIIASQNGTNITLTGGTLLSPLGGQTSLTNLSAGQWVEIVVELANNGCFISANNPVGVCTYLAGGQYNGSNPRSSDPAQAWLPSIEQGVYSALIAPFIPNGATQLNAHYALIVTPTATKSNTRVTIGAGVAQPLSGGSWRDHTSGYSFYSMPLTNTTSSYLFTNTTARLFVMGYGTGSAESYYYLASSAMRNLDAAFYVNDIHYQDLPSEAICNQPVEFRAELHGDLSSLPGFLKWYIDDVEVSGSCDAYTWDSIIAPGVYEVKLVALMNNNITTKTVVGTMTVASLAAPPISPFGRINVCPPTLSIPLTTTGDSCRWFKNGVPIPNHTSNVYNVTESGEYTVMILFSDCSSSMSDTATVLIGGFVRAYNDYAQVLINTPTKIPVIPNDSLGCCGSGGLIGPLVVIGQDCKHGSTTFVNDTLIYTPTAGFIGLDSVTYYIKCSADSSAAKVYMNVIDFPDNILDPYCFGKPSGHPWSFQEIATSATVVPDQVHTCSTPLAGDIDGDGLIEIIVPAGSGDFHTTSGLRIYKVSKQTNLTLIQTLNTGTVYVSGQVSIADVDGDGKAELFVVTNVLSCYKLNASNIYNTTPLWTASIPVEWVLQPMIADFNGDGTPEVLVGNRIYNAVTGSLVASGTFTVFGQGGHGSNASYRHISMMAVADFDNDGLPEIAIADSVYKVNIPAGTITLWKSCEARTDVGEGITAVADIDLDGFLDAIVMRRIPNTTNAWLYVWNPISGKLLHTNIIPVPTEINFGWGPSLPFVGDLDKDGYPEIAFHTVISNSTGQIRTYRYDKDLKELVQFWPSHINTADFSGATTMTLFDFDQNGENELVYRDMSYLRILRGSDGQDLITPVACGSGTVNEYPIVVDVNGDGSAEIVVTGGGYNSTSGDLRIFSSAIPGSWAPARKVWNQHSYNVVNINEDLTVPRYQLNPATVFPGDATSGIIRPYNGFLVQQTILGMNGMPIWLLPDIKPVPSISNTTLAGNAVSITLGMTNTGDAAIGPPVHIALYKGAVNTADTIMTVVVPIRLLPDDTVTVTITIPDIRPYLPMDSIIIRINDNGVTYPIFAECDTINNKITLINPGTGLLMVKNAFLNDALTFDNGIYSNPVAVLFTDTIRYEITAYNAGSTPGVTVIDTLPLYLDFTGIATDVPSESLTAAPQRKILTWNLSALAPQTSHTVMYKATPHAGVCASQPLFINRARVSNAVVTYFTNSAYHQGAGVSLVTFSAGYGGHIYNAEPQAVDYRSSALAGVVIAPDKGFRFAGWNHDDYISLRGHKIKAQSGVMQYDTLTVYGNVNLQAAFELEKYPIIYYLHGGGGIDASLNNPFSYTIESGDITLAVPSKTGDIFTGWTGTNGDIPQLSVTIPKGSTGERTYYANYLHSGRSVDEQPVVVEGDRVWTVGNELHVRTTKPGSILRIYTMNGVLIRQQTILQPGETKYRLPDGIYVVTLNNGIGEKIMVNN